MAAWRRNNRAAAAKCDVGVNNGIVALKIAYALAKTLSAADVNIAKDMQNNGRRKSKSEKAIRSREISRAGEAWQKRGRHGAWRARRWTRAFSGRKANARASCGARGCGMASRWRGGNVSCLRSDAACAAALRRFGMPKTAGRRRIAAAGGVAWVASTMKTHLQKDIAGISTSSCMAGRHTIANAGS